MARVGFAALSALSAYEQGACRGNMGEGGSCWDARRGEDTKGVERTEDPGSRVNDARLWMIADENKLWTL